MGFEQLETVAIDVGSRGIAAVKRALPTMLADKLVAARNRFLYSRTSQVIVDAVLVAVALSAAYLFRFDGDPPLNIERQMREVLPFAVLLVLWVNASVGVYKQIWRFFGLRDAALLLVSVAIAFLVALGWRIYGPRFAGGAIPLGVIIMSPLFAFGTMATGRLARRLLYAHAAALATSSPHPRSPKRVLLVGAGETGLHILKELRGRRHDIVGFVDDDEELQRRRIGGCPVVGTTNDLERIIATHEVDEVILCMPGATKAALQRIVARCDTLPVQISSVPTLGEIMSGELAHVGELRAVTLDALLGRHSIAHPQDITETQQAYGGRRILVTGAGGSIGSELIRQLRRFQPSELILLDKDENNLYEIGCEIREDFDCVVEVIGDIRNFDAMEKLFGKYRPDVVFHAAAYKHVPLMEVYPAEAILNNVIGTKNVAELSRTYGVKVFVLVSTDKAVNPSNTMGASKRVAEMIVQSLAAPTGGTRFCCVRFGNVLGSRASVVPIFQRQIRQGKSITVTHPDVTRYFMTIPEAVQLVIQAGALGDKGEIFLLDMGNPVKIVDLARNLIELSGLVPDKDIAIEFYGLRPGEKIDEELLIAGERSARSTKHSKIFVVAPLERDWSRVNTAVGALDDAARLGDAELIHAILKDLEIGYHNGRHEPQAGNGVTPSVPGDVLANSHHATTDHLLVKTL
jgi:FlaA1/EpsC-like NDP-sugar epimerase